MKKTRNLINELITNFKTASNTVLPAKYTFNLNETRGNNFR